MLVALDPGVNSQVTITQLDSTPNIAAVTTEVTSAQADERIIKLTAYLQSKDSILADYSVDFVTMADKYGLDWKLLAAISGDESGFAKQYVGGTYNAWGWGGGYLYLGSWTNAIETLSKALKDEYAAKGAVTVPQIGRIWAADPGWSTKVQRYMNEIDRFTI